MRRKRVWYDQQDVAWKYYQIIKSLRIQPCDPVCQIKDLFSDFRRRFMNAVYKTIIYPKLVDIEPKIRRKNGTYKTSTEIKCIAYPWKLIKMKRKIDKYDKEETPKTCHLKNTHINFSPLVLKYAKLFYNYFIINVTRLLIRICERKRTGKKYYLVGITSICTAVSWKLLYAMYMSALVKTDEQLVSQEFL